MKFKPKTPFTKKWHGNSAALRRPYKKVRRNNDVAAIEEGEADGICDPPDLGSDQGDARVAPPTLPAIDPMNHSRQARECCPTEENETW